MPVSNTGTRNNQVVKTRSRDDTSWQTKLSASREFEKATSLTETCAGGTGGAWPTNVAPRTLVPVGTKVVIESRVIYQIIHA